jgi:formiminoglutamate deiminase
MASLWFSDALLTDGWQQRVRITIGEQGQIIAIDRDVGPQICDSRFGVALPGMANLHSHAFQRGMAGLTETRRTANEATPADSFWSWRDIMYRFVDRLNPDTMAAIAAMAYVEMLETGFTRVGEFHYLHHDQSGAAYADRAAMAAAIAQAATTSGIALTLLPVFYACSDFGGAEPTTAQRRFTNTIDEYVDLHHASRAAIAHCPDAVIGVAPHSLRAVNTEQLHDLIRFAGQSPLHIHIAEQQREVEACLAWSGARPVEWLLANTPVAENYCLVHATHISAKELTSIITAGAIVGLCPITEANLGDGLFPASTFISSGGRFGIGSDSNVRIDAMEELRWLEYGQRLWHQSRNTMASDAASTGATLFSKSRQGGFAALGASDAGLSVGSPADFFSLCPNHPNLSACTEDAWLDALIFSGGREVIDGVWRRGRQIVCGGRHVARDKVEAGYRAAMLELMAG